MNYPYGQVRAARREDSLQGRVENRSQVAFESIKTYLFEISVGNNNVTEDFALG